MGAKYFSIFLSMRREKYPTEIKKYTCAAFTPHGNMAMSFIPYLLVWNHNSADTVIWDTVIHGQLIPWIVWLSVTSSVFTISIAETLINFYAHKYLVLPESVSTSQRIDTQPILKRENIDKATNNKKTFNSKLKRKTVKKENPSRKKR